MRAWGQGGVGARHMLCVDHASSRDQRPGRDLQLCQAIPVGSVTTYGAMAAALRSSPRAVGQAMRRNPYAPCVPCHRVVASNGCLGGFGGSWVRRDCRPLGVGWSVARGRPARTARNGGRGRRQAGMVC